MEERRPPITPQLALARKEIPEGEGWAYEPKYDGIRALASVSPAGTRLWSRLGNEKTTQFPEIAEALRALGRKAERELVVDGETSPFAGWTDLPAAGALTVSVPDVIL